MTVGKTVALIPARGGSKSIPRKSIAPLGGKPLLAWSIDVARAVPELDRVIVSTDAEDIAEVARCCGAEVSIRPPEFATDTALVIDTVRHLLRTLAADGYRPRNLVLLEPTCPFRSPDDIRHCLAALENEDIDSVATFKLAELNPMRAWKINDGTPETFIPGANPWLPRQQLPPAYQLNGAVYAVRADRLPDGTASMIFGRMAALIMPPERSVDIDHPLDLVIAEAMVQETRNR